MTHNTGHIRYIGVDDLTIDLFEGQYPVPNGISYNSYVIFDEKIAVIDAVDVNYADQWLGNLAEALDGRNPDYIVIQHVEPDHSGALEAFLLRYPDTVVVATAAAVGYIGNFVPDVDISGRVLPVKDGDTLQLGRDTLRFITAPLVHWPEVMMTLDEQAGVLFSADAFGTFDVYRTDRAWDDEARRYYTNIVGKLGAHVVKVMRKIAGLKFEVIAPLHGPLLTGNLARPWQLYERWSTYTPEADGVLVAYASVYGGTADAAHRLAAMLRRNGHTDVVEVDLCRTHLSYAVAEAFRLGKMVLCSITCDGDLFPPMYNFLHHLQLKGICNRRVGIVENGTWAPVAARKMQALLQSMPGMTVVSPVVTLRSCVHDADIPALEELAKAL